MVGEKDTIKHNEEHVSQGVEMLYDESDNTGHVMLTVSGDRMKAHLTITRESQDKNYSLKEIENILEKSGIRGEINEDGITRELSKLNAPGDTTDTFIVCEGKKASDSAADLLQKHFDETDPNVEENALLIEVLEPQSAIEGMDVIGKPIPSHAVRKPNIKAGKNVRADDNHSKFFSEISGKAVFEDNTISVFKTLEIVLSEDKLECRVSYFDKEPLQRDRLRRNLEQMGVSYGIDKEAIEKALKMSQSGTDVIRDEVIARGDPCVPGSDGQIVFNFSTDDEKSFETDDDGRVDYRTSNTGKSVTVDQELAILKPHVLGKAGKDVCGDEIRPPEVIEASLKPGENVRISEDGTHFYSEIEGKPVFLNDTLSVSEVLPINGNVDMSVGNIDFHGCVQIKGDIEDDFTIKAKKSITVGGVIGASSIEAGADVVIEGGYNAKNKSTLYTKGNLTVKYINEADIKAEGNIYVQNEIINSKIRSLGRVFVEKGTIVGGEIIALGGVETNTLGSPMGVKTHLLPGVDFKLDDKLRDIDTKLDEISSEVEKINSRVGPLLRNKARLKSLPPEKLEIVKKTVAHLSKMKKEKEMLVNEKDELRQKSSESAIPEVTVKQTLFPGIQIRIGDSQKEIKKEHKGPLSLTEDYEYGTIKIGTVKKNLRKEENDEAELSSSEIE